MYKNKYECGIILEDITSYRGTAKNPEWIDMEPGMHSRIISLDSQLFTDYTRDVFNAVYGDSRHVTTG